MKKIIFVTATRADYDKLKTTMVSSQRLKNFKSYVFVTGMHNMQEYGSIHEHIKKDKIKNVKKFVNQKLGFRQDKVLSNTIVGKPRQHFTQEVKPPAPIVKSASSMSSAIFSFYIIIFTSSLILIRIFKSVLFFFEPLYFY